jgi:hypothetical protein
VMIVGQFKVAKLPLPRGLIDHYIRHLYIHFFITPLANEVNF